MKCPRCSETALVVSYRDGVEIDHCPECRGVWLDRGELDKLIERSATMESAAGDGEAGRSPPGFADSDQGRSPRGHRKDSWLRHIFD